MRAHHLFDILKSRASSSQREGTTLYGLQHTLATQGIRRFVVTAMLRVWEPIRTCAYALVYTIRTCAVLVEMDTVTSHIWSIITQVRMVHTIRTCGKMEESSDVTVSISTKTAQVRMVYTSAYGFPYPAYTASNRVPSLTHENKPLC